MKEGALSSFVRREHGRRRMDDGEWTTLAVVHSPSSTSCGSDAINRTCDHERMGRMGRIGAQESLNVWLPPYVCSTIPVCAERTTRVHDVGVVLSCEEKGATVACAADASCSVLAANALANACELPPTRRTRQVSVIIRTLHALIACTFL